MGTSKPSPGPPFFGSDADIDSLDILLLLGSIEKEFALRIPGDAVGREVFRTEGHSSATSTAWRVRHESGMALGTGPLAFGSLVTTSVPAVRSRGFVVGVGVLGCLFATLFALAPLPLRRERVRKADEPVAAPVMAPGVGVNSLARVILGAAKDFSSVAKSTSDPSEYLRMTMPRASSFVRSAQDRTG